MSPVVKYFYAEKIWCAAGAGLAVLSIVLALWFLLRVRHPLQTGMAWPFMLLGLIFFVICLTVALRSNSDASRVSSWLADGKSNLASQELPRMTGVMKTFTVIISVEVLMLAASISCLLFLNMTRFTRGVILGILLQCCWLFIFDMFARSRGAEYLNYIKSVTGV
jgi:hypothetical protein